MPLLLGGDLGPLRRALAAVGPATRTADPWLALTAAITHLEARALPAAAAELESARRSWSEPPSAGLEALRASAELLASGQGLDVGSSTPSPDDADRTPPEMAALLHASRAAAEFGHPGGPDVDLARTELEAALDLARALDLGYLEVQSLSMLATLAGMRGRLRDMAAAAEQAVAAAVRCGRHPSEWSAAPMGMLAYVDLLRGDPVAAAARSEEALGLGPAASGSVVHLARRARRRTGRSGTATGRARRDAHGARGLR